MTDRRELARQALEVLADIPEREWGEHHYSGPELGRHCALGHLGAGAHYGWSPFAELAEMHFDLAKVNDRNDPAYRHPTPKQRVCEYLLDVYEGKR